MRIALFIPNLEGGGAERVTVSLANEFASRGFDVDLVLVSAKGPYLADVNPSVRIVDLGAKRTFSAIPRLVGYLKTCSPSVLLSALGHANIAAVFARSIARSSTQVVVTEHSTLSVSLSRISRARANLLRLCLRLAYQRAAAMVAVSNGVANDLERCLGLGPGKVRTIYNPVVTSSMLAQSHDPIEHPWLQQRAVVPVVLAVGRLTAPKDFPTLLNAFARLRARRQVRLIILGDGPLRNELALLIEHLGIGADVEMPGFVANPFAWMRSASQFVLASAWEGLPTVLIEAMACGVPVVSTDCPSGPFEILEGGKWGHLTPVGDADALARAMDETLNQSVHAPAAERARHFTSELAVDRYLSLMRGLALP